eukprot:1292267-Rhodomonas_salina.1
MLAFDQAHLQSGWEGTNQRVLNKRNVWLLQREPFPLSRLASQRSSSWRPRGMKHTIPCLSCTWTGRETHDELNMPAPPGAATIGAGQEADARPRAPLRQ